jgi:hypothetical protein
MSRQHEQDEHDEAARAEKSAVDEVLAELRRESQAHAKDLVDLDHAELRLAFETFAMRLSRHGVAVPSIHGPAMIIRVVDLYLLDITDRLARQVKLRVRAEQREAEAKSQVADLALELLGASHQHELLAAGPQGDGQAERARVALDDIRCDILNAGWPLGDDADQELTPRRLVREVLAEVSSLRARLLDDAQVAAGVQHGLHARAVAAESALARLLAAPAPAPALSPATPEDQASVEPGAVTASELAPTSPPVSAPTPPAARRWRLASALLERLPEALQHLKVLQRRPSSDLGIEADALCVAPDGAHWVVLHEDFIEGEFDDASRQVISVRRADEHGKPIRDCEFHYATLLEDQLPVVVPDEDPVLPG